MSGCSRTVVVDDDAASVDDVAAVDDEPLAALLLAFDDGVVDAWVSNVVLIVVVGAGVVVGLGFSGGKIGGYAIGTSAPLINLFTEDPT